MLRSDQDGVQQETVAPVDLNIESAARSDNSRLARRTQKPESALSTLAGDLMSSPAITASAADPVSSVARRMLETGVNGMPVVDAAGASGRQCASMNLPEESRLGPRRPMRTPSLTMPTGT
jgi:CBS domain-containing protein